MKTATEVFFDPTIYGHSLVEPLQWYGRSVSQLFTTSFPKEFFLSALEVVVRIVTFVALLVFSPSLIVTAPCALLGWAIKYSQPIPPLRNSETSPPIPPKPKIIQTAQKTPEPSPRNPVSSPSSLVPLTPEILRAARCKVEELRVLCNGLKELSGPDARNLFAGIAEFRSLYEGYRSSDPFNVDEMTKTFNTLDAIAANTSGMQIALQHWMDFYRVQADAQGIVPQPKDGNCWLHTSIVGLQHINHPDLGEDTHLTLRTKVVEWMLTHYPTDETLRRFIEDAIETHKTVEARLLRVQRDSLSVAIMGNLIPSEEVNQAQAALENYERSLEDLVNFSLHDYFNHMRIVGSHGSHAELYAISRMFQVNVAIWRDIPAGGDLPSRLTKEFDEQISSAHAEHTVNAVLTQEGNHFNYLLPYS